VVVEYFAIASVEATAAGKPAVAFVGGGASTVVRGVTCAHRSEANPEACHAAVRTRTEPFRAGVPHDSRRAVFRRKVLADVVAPSSDNRRLSGPWA
jgi:hypothetical protein